MSKANEKQRRRSPDPAVLNDIVNRIVDVAQPERIVLFGSAARGTMGPDNDLDLLVIKGGKFNRDRITIAIYRALRGKGALRGSRFLLCQHSAVDDCFPKYPSQPVIRCRVYQSVAEQPRDDNVAGN